MLARNFLAVAAAGGLAIGTLTGLTWHPRMKMAPLRPWQAGARPVDPRDVMPAQAYRDAIPLAYPVAYPTYTPPAAVYEPLPRLVLAADVVPQRPELEPAPEPDAADMAEGDPADAGMIAMATAAPLPGDGMPPDAPADPD